jgi:hypothetical protein
MQNNIRVRSPLEHLADLLILRRERDVAGEGKVAAIEQVRCFGKVHQYLHGLHEARHRQVVVVSLDLLLDLISSLVGLLKICNAIHNVRQGSSAMWEDDAHVGVRSQHVGQDQVRRCPCRLMSQPSRPLLSKKGFLIVGIGR